MKYKNSVLLGMFYFSRWASTNERDAEEARRADPETITGKNWRKTK